MPPQYLYKYLEINPGSLNAIRDATLKFTLPKDFNDPFDCLASYSDEYINRSIKAQGAYLYRAKGNKKLSPANRLKAEGRAKRRARFNNLNGGVFSPIRDGDIGVLSLSSNKDNLLMWSHYCRNHTGFVLQFEPVWFGLRKNLEDRIIVLEELVALEVMYSIERPVLNGLEDNSLKLDKLLLTKSSDWAYESEFRVIDNVRKSGIHPYKRELLKGVYAGAKINSEELQSLKDTVTEANSNHSLNIKLFQMQLQANSFSLKEHEIQL